MVDYIIFSNTHNFSRILRLEDEIIALIALLSYIGGLILFALSKSLTSVFLSAVLAFGTRMSDSILRSLVSQKVEEDEIGKVFGVVAVAGDLSLILGSAIFNSMFTPLMKATGEPGAAYLVGSSFLLLPFLLTLSGFLTRRCRQSPERKEPSHDNEGYQSDWTI